MSIYHTLYRVVSDADTSVLFYHLNLAEHDTTLSFDDFCGMVEPTASSIPWSKGRKHTEESKKKMSEVVKRGFDNGRPPNITFLGRKHSAESRAKQKAIQSNRSWKPSQGKTWKRSPESVARALETRRLNKLKKLGLDPSQ